MVAGARRPRAGDRHRPAGMGRPQPPARSGRVTPRRRWPRSTRGGSSGRRSSATASAARSRCGWPPTIPTGWPALVLAAPAANLASLERLTAGWPPRSPGADERGVADRARAGPVGRPGCAGGSPARPAPEGYLRALRPALLTPWARRAFAAEQRSLLAICRRSSARLPRSSAPTWIMTGAEDRIVPRPAPRALAEQIPGARLVSCDGPGTCCRSCTPGRWPRRSWRRSTEPPGANLAVDAPPSGSAVDPAGARSPALVARRWRRCAGAAPALGGQARRRPRAGRDRARVLRARRAHRGQAIVSIRASTVSPAWVVVKSVRPQAAGRTAAAASRQAADAPTSTGSAAAQRGAADPAGGPGRPEPATSRSRCVYSGSGWRRSPTQQTYRSSCAGGGGFIDKQNETVTPMSWTVRYVVDLDRLQAAVRTPAVVGARAHGGASTRAASRLERHEKLTPHLRRQRLLRQARRTFTCTSALPAQRAGGADSDALVRPRVGTRDRDPDARSTTGQVRPGRLHARPVAVGQRREDRPGRQARI